LGLPYLAVGWDCSSPVQQTAMKRYWNDTWLKTVELLGDTAAPLSHALMVPYRDDPRYKPNPSQQETGGKQPI